MSLAPPPSTIISLVLSTAKSPLAFERFCVKHYSAVEGITYVPTSYNYDNARDARTEFTALARGTSYICASCTHDDAEKKAEKDLTTLLRHDPRPGKIRFCFTAPVTEAKRDRIFKRVQKLAPSALAEVVGLVQLEESIGRSPSAFEEVFDTELKAIERYRPVRNGQDNVAPSMRAALSTQLDPNAVALRISLLCGLVLDCLSSSPNCSSEELCAHITTSLSLQTPVHNTYISTAIEELDEQGAIERNRGTFRLTSRGERQNERRRLAASGRILAGCSAIRRVLDQAVGKTIREEDFVRIWPVIEDGLSNLFQQNGLAIVKGIAQMADEQFSPTGTDHKTDILGEGLRDIARRIRSLGLIGNTGDKIAEILPQALSDPDGLGYEWITDLCILYIAGCSLSLDPNVQDQIAARIRSWEIIPDTHVLLSAIGQGEENHDAVREVIKGWKSAGGQLFVAEPVLEETARHAEIAWRKLRQWCTENGKWRARSSKKERAASIPSDNVFLRSYKHCAGARATPGGASEYLSNFVGEHEKGCSRLRRLVVEELGLNVLAGLQIEKSLAAKIAKELHSERMRGCYDANEAKAFQRRSECDGRLVATLASRRKSNTSPKFVAIVSLSSRLRTVCENHLVELGMQSAVIRLSRLTFALTLLPRSSMSLSGLRTVLFDPYFGTQVSSSYELAQRVFRSDSLHRHEMSGKIQLAGKLDSALAGR